MGHCLCDVGDIVERGGGILRRAGGHRRARRGNPPASRGTSSSEAGESSGEPGGLQPASGGAGVGGGGERAGALCGAPWSVRGPREAITACSRCAPIGGGACRGPARAAQSGPASLPRRRYRHVIGAMIRRLPALLTPALLCIAGVASAQDATAAGAVTAPYPTLQNVSIEWAITGDDDADGVVTVRYRRQRSAALPLREARSAAAACWAVSCPQ
jgi:hypothetical protein